MFVSDGRAARVPKAIGNRKVDSDKSTFASFTHFAGDRAPPMVNPELKEPVQLLSGLRAVGVGDQWSVGSVSHMPGTCRPCAYVNSILGCKYGSNCRFCHILEGHSEPPRMRPCKARRERLKRVMAVLEANTKHAPPGLAAGSASFSELHKHDAKVRPADRSTSRGRGVCPWMPSSTSGLSSPARPAEVAFPPVIVDTAGIAESKPCPGLGQF
mmetsp:Transcript_100230/g.196794  ORF Transcript_100230/g.196794 Transcript_100230/m.196794 type:complete len:213 (-) Transcript_100230:154-792(-)